MATRLPGDNSANTQNSDSGDNTQPKPKTPPSKKPNIIDITGSGEGGTVPERRSASLQSAREVWDEETRRQNATSAHQVPILQIGAGETGETGTTAATQGQIYDSLLNLTRSTPQFAGAQLDGSALDNTRVAGLGMPTITRDGAQIQPSGEVIPAGQVGSDWLPPASPSDQGRLTARATDAPAQAVDTTVSPTDKSTTTKYSDNSVVVKDANNNLQSVTDAQGRTTSFSWQQGADGKPQLAQVTNSDGTWHPVAGTDQWQTTDGSKTFNGTITTDSASGSFSWKDSASGTSQTWRPDGTHDATYKDGTNVSFNADGVPTKATDGKGAPLTLDNNANAASIARDGSFSFKDGSGNVTTVNADSTRSIHQTDGSTQKTDAQGRATSLTGADGKVLYQYEYDQKTGDVSSMRNQYGWWDRQADGSYKNVGDATQPPLLGTLKVNSDGGYTFTKPKQPGDAYSEVQTTHSDGSSTIQHTDGSSVTDKADGSVVTAKMFGDGQSHVVSVKTADNQLYSFDRSANGDLTGYTNSDGHWTTKDGQTWTNDNPAVPSWQGSVAVNDKGDVSYQQQGSDTLTTKHSDGTTSLIKGGDSPSTIVSDKNGNIISTTDASGNVNQYGYDVKTGKLNSATIGGTAWNSADGGQTWQANGMTRSGTMTLDQTSGDLTFAAQQGTAETMHLDGTRTMQRSDGSSEQINRNGYISSVTDGSGKTYNYGYDANNNITSVQMPDGTKLSRNDASQPFSDGQGHQFTNLSLDGKGNLSYREQLTDATGAVTAGATINHNADGSYLKANSDGTAAEGRDAAGNTFKNTYVNGKLVEVNSSKDGDWKSTDGGVTFSNGTHTSRDLTVDQSGNLRRTDESGNFVGTFMDGTTINRKPDGSLVSTDKNGDTNRILTSTGDDYSFKHDKNVPGGISEVTNNSANSPWNGTWSTKDGKTWTQVDPDSGAPVPGKDGQPRTWNGTVQVKDGTYSYTSAKGDTTTTLGGDKVQVQTHDGTTYIKEGKNITSATDSAGHQFKYNYDTQGNLSGVSTSRDGKTWSDVPLDGKTAVLEKNGLPTVTDKTTGAVTKFQT
ncbi:MAG TPA: RHS repeat domain-containing protein, partial [Trichormus sp.]